MHMQVVGLKGLTQLVELDLSGNLISTLDPKELPTGLRHLQVETFVHVHFF